MDSVKYWHLARVIDFHVSGQEEFDICRQAEEIRLKVDCKLGMQMIVADREPIKSGVLRFHIGCTVTDLYPSTFRLVATFKRMAVVLASGYFEGNLLICHQCMSIQCLGTKVESL